ncbi:MAG: RecX family transcriptional regulator, partial [Candidatus Accumulibacter sp.]|nr:RecX family transcriptional regulator [Accumulibacter sp.]
ASRARQANFLARRGFSGETIRRVLRGGREDD